MADDNATPRTPRTARDGEGTPRTPRETPRSERSARGTPRASSPRAGGLETGRSSGDTVRGRAKPPDWFKPRTPTPRADDTAGDALLSARRRSESPRQARRTSSKPLPATDPAAGDSATPPPPPARHADDARPGERAEPALQPRPAVESGIPGLKLWTGGAEGAIFEPGQLSLRLMPADMRGAAQSIKALHMGVGTHVLLSGNYDGQPIFDRVPPRHVTMPRGRKASGPRAKAVTDLGIGDPGRRPNRKGAVPPWVVESGNLIAGEVPDPEQVRVREKPPDAFGKSTAQSVQQLAKRERHSQAHAGTAWRHDTADDIMYGRNVDVARPVRVAEPGVAGARVERRRAEPAGAEGGAGADAPPPAPRNSAWVNDTSDELIFRHDINLAPPPRQHDSGAAGKSTAEFDAEDDHLDNVGPRARARQYGSFVPDTADELLLGRDLDYGHGVRQHDHDAAGRSSMDISAEVNKYETVGPRVKMRSAAIWQDDVADEFIVGHDIDLNHMGVRDARGYAGSTSRAVDLRKAREMMRAKPKPRNRAWKSDVADDLIYGRDIDQHVSPRQHEPGVAGKSSADVDREALKYDQIGARKARNDAWVHDTSDELIFGHDINQAPPPRQHASGTAGKSSLEFDAEDDHLDNVGPRARARRQAAWVHDTSDELIFGHDINLASTPRRHAPGTAGKSSTAMRTDFEGSGELFVVSEPRPRNNAWVPDTSDDLMLNRDLDQGPPPRTPSREVAGKSSLAFADEIRRRDVAQSAKSAHASAWVKEEGVGKLIFGGDTVADVRARESDADAAGKKSTDIAVEELPYPQPRPRPNNSWYAESAGDVMFGRSPRNVRPPRSHQKGVAGKSSQAAKEDIEAKERRTRNLVWAYGAL